MYLGSRSHWYMVELDKKYFSPSMYLEYGFIVEYSFLCHGHRYMVELVECTWALVVISIW